MPGDTDDVLTIKADDRSFLIERESKCDVTTTPGWLLREFYETGGR